MDKNDWKIIDINDIDRIKKWFKIGFKEGNRYYPLSDNELEEYSEETFLKILTHLKRVE